ncbi:MAG: hypothetical protein GX847_08725 [Clostridiales bacterium]|nr:hypothetical protein [Clostridiales bacterium]
MNPLENSSTNLTGLSLTGAFSHAYIVWGGSDAGQYDFAVKLAAALICEGAAQKPCMTCAHCEKAFRHIHPDIIDIEKEADSRQMLVDQIRSLKEDAIIMPNEASKKVYIIHSADFMNLSAQNAILKLLEDPPESSAFILKTENPAKLLPTVRSRCVELSAGRQEKDVPDRIRDYAEAFCEALSDSSLKLTELLFALEKLDKSAFADFITEAKGLLVSKMKDLIISEGDTPIPAYMLKVVGVLDRAREYLDCNVGLGHITGMICAELIQGGGDLP